MAVNVARIFEETIRLGKPYCRICLRTTEETMLVIPRYLNEFAKMMNLNIFRHYMESRRPSVCYYCEAVAGKTLKFYLACLNAQHYQKVIQPLQNMKADDLVPDKLRKGLIDCNAAIQDYRKKSRLQPTEVLIIDSAGIECSGNVLGVPKETPSANKVRSNRNIQDDLPPQPVNPLSPSIETVVLVDDDEDDTPVFVQPSHQPKMPTLVPIEQLLASPSSQTDVAALLPNQMKIISRHNEDPSSFILHPVVMGENGNLVVPSLGGEIQDGQLSYNQALYQKLPMIDFTSNNNSAPGILVQGGSITQENSISIEVEASADRNTETFVMQNTKEVSSEMTIEETNAEVDSILENFLSSKTTVKKRNNKNTSNTAKRTRHNPNISKENPSNSVNDNSFTPIGVISSVASNSDGMGMISDVDSSDSNATSGGIGRISEVKSQVVGPLRKSCKIDWEDKIPMDVISFVDATDPHNRDFILSDPLAPLPSTPNTPGIPPANHTIPPPVSTIPPPIPTIPPAITRPPSIPPPILAGQLTTPSSIPITSPAEPNYSNVSNRPPKNPTKSKPPTKPTKCTTPRQRWNKPTRSVSELIEESKLAADMRKLHSSPSPSDIQIQDVIDLS